MKNRAVPMPRPETRASPNRAVPLLSTVMLLAVIVTTTCQLRTGVAHDIVRPLSNVAEIDPCLAPARSSPNPQAVNIRPIHPIFFSRSSARALDLTTNK